MSTSHLYGLNDLTAGFASFFNVFTAFSAFRGLPERPDRLMVNELNRLIPDNVTDEERLKLLKQYRQISNGYQRQARAEEPGSSLLITRINGNLKSVLVTGQAVSVPMMNRMYSWLLDLELAQYLPELFMEDMESIKNMEESLENLLDQLPQLEDAIAAAAGGDDGDPDRNPDDDQEPALFIAGNSETGQWMPFLHDQSLYSESMRQKLRLLRILRRRVREAIASGQRDLARIFENRIMVIGADLSELAGNESLTVDNPAFRNLLLCGWLDNFQEVLAYERTVPINPLPSHSMASQLLNWRSSAGRQVPGGGNNDQKGGNTVNSSGQTDKGESPKPSSSGSKTSSKSGGDGSPGPDQNNHSYNMGFCPACEQEPCKFRFQSTQTRSEQSEKYKKQVTLHLTPVNNEAAQRIINGKSEHEFASVINVIDLFYLTGEQEEGIVRINNQMARVLGTSEVGEGQIHLNPGFDYEPGDTVEVESLGKELEKVRKVVFSVDLSLPDDTGQKPLMFDDNSHTKSIISCFNGFPIVKGQKYHCYIPAPEESDLPLLPIIVTAFPVGLMDDALGPFLLDNYVEAIVSFSNPENLYSKRFRVGIPDPQKNLRNTCFEVIKGKFTSLNSVDLNIDLWKALTCGRAQDTRLNDLILQMGSFCYVATSFDGRPEPRLLTVNNSYQGPQSCKNLKTWEGALTKASRCDIFLSWLNDERRPLGRDSGSIKEEVRKALKWVPLQKGRHFLVNLPLESDKNFAIKGEITGVASNPPDAQAARIDSVQSAPAVLPMIGDSTELELKVDDECILSGEKPAEIDEIMFFKRRVCRDLAGMEGIAERLYHQLNVCRMLFNQGDIDFCPKGVLLYGPPGTGKTAIARNLAHALNPVTITEIYGSDCLKKEASASTSELWDKFCIAIAQKATPGTDDGFFVYLIHDIDQMCLPPLSNKPAAPTSSQTAVTNYLQELMSGHSPDIDNMVIIATTNRDASHFPEALLRPGRFSVQIPVNHPDEDQRKKIFTKLFSDQDKTLKDISFDEMASLTRGKSCAALKQLVASTITQAVLKNPHEVDKNVIQREDFFQALCDKEETRASFKKAMDKLGGSMTKLVFNCESEAAKSVLEVLNKIANPLGKQNIILVKFRPYFRTDVFCQQLLHEAQEKFDYFSCVSLLSATARSVYSQLVSTENHVRSLILIQDLLPVLEHTESNDPTLIGKYWQGFKSTHKHRNVAVVGLVEDTNFNRYLFKDITKTPYFAVKKEFDLTSTLSAADIRSYMEQLGDEVKPETIDSIVAIFGNNCPPQKFIELLKSNRLPNKDGFLQWDLDDLEEAYQYQPPTNHNYL